MRKTESGTKKIVKQSRVKLNVNELSSSSQSVGTNQKIFPLTNMQERMWNIERSHKSPSGIFNMVFAYRINGLIDYDILRRSFSYLYKRHESLRTVFIKYDSQPIQRVMPYKEFSLEIINQTELDNEEKEKFIQDFCKDKGKLPFNLSVGPLIRVYLINFNVKEHVLVVNKHHMISDGVSNNILLNELQLIYNGLLEGLQLQLPTLPSTGYKEYAFWLRYVAEKTIFPKEISYWRNKIKKDFIPIKLPYDFQIENKSALRGKTYSTIIDKNLYNSLCNFTDSMNISLFMTFLSVFKVLLYNYNSTKISVGTPIANRIYSNHENVLGYFANKIVLSSDLSGNPSFSEIVSIVRKVCLEAYTNQSVPFERLFDSLKSEQKNIEYDDFFRSVFIFQDSTDLKMNLNGLEIVPININSEISKFDLLLSISKINKTFRVSFTYKTDLFKQETIEYLMYQFLSITKKAMFNPDIKLSEMV